MTNIYEKQMKKLGVNADEYSKLTGIPVEVINDITKGKGNYSMELTKYLRGNLFNKRDEIENNLEDSKLKVLEIKNNDIDYLDWYNNEFDVKEFLSKLNLKTNYLFREKYLLKVDNKEASKWFYDEILRTDKLKMKLSNRVKKQLIKQLYDIDNGNSNKYLRTEEFIEKPTKVKEFSRKEIEFYRNWKKTFDFEKFLRDNKLTVEKLCKNLSMTRDRWYHMKSKKVHCGTSEVKKVYDYVKSLEQNQEPIIEESEVVYTANDLRQAQINGEVEKVKEINEQLIDKQVEVENNNAIIQQNVILRNLLKSRLTDEEKYLIILFNGKIE